jgi:hypothetical protein
MWNVYMWQANNRHTIILMQPGNRATRTFMDYDSIASAMDGVFLYTLLAGSFQIIGSCCDFYTKFTLCFGGV